MHWKVKGIWGCLLCWRHSWFSVLACWRSPWWNFCILFSLWFSSLHWLQLLNVLCGKSSQLFLSFLFILLLNLQHQFQTAEQWSFTSPSSALLWLVKRINRWAKHELLKVNYSGWSCCSNVTSIHGTSSIIYRIFYFIMLSRGYGPYRGRWFCIIK